MPANELTRKDTLEQIRQMLDAALDRFPDERGKPFIEGVRLQFLGGAYKTDREVIEVLQLKDATYRDWKKKVFAWMRVEYPHLQDYLHE